MHHLKDKYEVVSDRYVLRYEELYRLFTFTVYLWFICSCKHGLHNLIILESNAYILRYQLVV